MWTFCFIAAFSLVLLSLSDGLTITGVKGEDKVFQWTLNPMTTSSVYVLVLHPAKVKNSEGKEDYASLYAALGTSVIISDTNLGRRVMNTNNTDTGTGHIEFTLTGLTLEDAGDYRARYDLNTGIGMISPVGLTLVIYVNPTTPSLIEEVPPVVGSAMVLKCSATSNSKPDGHGLQMNYKWNIDTSDLPADKGKYNASGQYLQVKNIQKTDLSTVVTCEAFENISMLSDVSDGHTIVPKYGPDVVQINTTETHELVENKDIFGPINCSADCEPACKYQWKFHGVDIDSQNGVLTISNIEPRSAGIYWCVASNIYATRTSSNVTVVVKYGPNSVTLSPNITFYNPVQGRNRTLGPINCSSDCYPECSYQWLHDGSLVTSTASLTITNITRSSTGLYVCRVSNTVGNRTSSPVNISVEYKPEHITLKPSDLQEVLFENETLGPINCSADCYPPCEYRWLHNSKNTTKSAVLHKERVQRDDNGTYICVAWNEHGEIRSTNVSLDVNYGPDNVLLTPNNSSYVLVENIRDSLGPVICWAECKPECTYTWTWNNTVLDSQKGNLTFHDVKRGKEGTYTCTASNRGRLNKTNIQVNIEYGPGTIILSPSKTSYNLLEKNETLPAIYCSTYCRPLCEYKWKLDRHDIDSNLMTKRQTANRTMAGKYQCFAKNNHNTSYVTIEVVVEYAPDIPKLVKSTKGDIMENKSVSLTCTTDSVPLPEINIMSLEADGKNDASINSLNNTLTIKQAQCLDTGDYKCDANNTIGSSSSHPVMLNITCLPRPDHRFAIQKNIYIGNNGSLDITALVIANPAPVLSWTFNGTDNKTLTNSSDGFIYYQSAHHVTYTSRIVKSNVEVGDYGQYTLRAVNTLGETDVLFNVIAQRSPDPPYGGTVNCNSGTAAVVTWKSNFNGGGKQHFLVKTYKEIGKQEKPDERYKDKGLHVEHEANVENMSPDTRYSFIVEAHNDNGESKIGENLSCTTKDNTATRQAYLSENSSQWAGKEWHLWFTGTFLDYNNSHWIYSEQLDDDDDSGNSAAVIGGAAGGSLALIIIIVILGVTLFVKRRRQKKEDDTQLMNMGVGNALQDDPDDGMRRNILYESAGPNYIRQNDGPSDSEYAVVDKSRGETSNKSETPADDPSAVYSVVRKQKNGKKGEPKQKDKKKAKNNVKGGKKQARGASRGDVYENVTVNADDVYANVDNNTNQAPTRDKALSRRKNQDGLDYIEVEILNNGRGVKLNGIHGADKRVDYVDIDFTRRADPLPSSSDDDDDENDKNVCDKNQ